MAWVKLVDWSRGAIAHGAVLRFPAEHSYEHTVDFLVFDPREADRGLGLLVDSGYKAGLIANVLPKESSGEFGNGLLCPTWLVANWSRWVYPTHVNTVFITRQRPVPRLPT